jgi:hypothetical protein
VVFAFLSSIIPGFRSAGRGRPPEAAARRLALRL